MRNVVAAAASVVAVAIIVVSLAVSKPGPAASELTWESKILTASELASVGLTPEPLTAGAPAPRISASDAVRIAGELDARTDDPAEILRAMIAPDASSLPRSAYLVIFLGGPPIPGGPEGKLHPVNARGIVIDDQTGEYLRGFYL